MAADQQQQQQPVPLKVLALLSGGKDSCFNLMHCAALGHEIVALANLHPPDGAGDELDSWMYQTVGHDVIPLYAEALGKPLYRAPVTGRAVQSGMTYHAADADADADADAPPALGDEVEDLYRLIQTALAQHPSINAVSSGAIRSDYQRLRVENVCARLGLRSLGYLWMRDQAALLRAMIACDVDARLVKVAGMGLQPRHLGQSLAQMAPTLAALHTRYGTHVCGEGGEYETLTLDCPLFVRRIVLDATETVVTDADPMAPVAYLRTRAAHTEAKPPLAADAYASMNGTRGVVALHHITAPTPTPSANAGGDMSADAGAVSFDDECRAALNEVAARLQTARVPIAHVVFVLLALSDMKHFTEANACFRQTFAATNPPARACLGLPLPDGRRVAVSVYATRTTPQDFLHVQSTSFWAPANIGPYSQAV
ncbi:hypothetical protein CXG81DRAFT_13391, partial [Caulochytrium protostelioides]